MILASLRRFVPAGSRLLDFGCGAGGLTAELAAHYQVVGVDSSGIAIGRARSRGLDVAVVAAGDPPPSGFDAVCAFDVIEHVDDDVHLLRRLTGAVRPGGRIIVTVPAFQSLWGTMDDIAGHRRRYRLAGLSRAMETAGINRLHATYFNTFLFPAAAVARLIGFPKPNREIDRPPRSINAVLSMIFRSEAPLASRLRLPAGTSILFVGATRPA